jgi:hypothetical protein
MPRLSIPATITEAPVASQALLEGVQKKLGVTPNLFRLVSKSPSALQGYLGLLDALSRGTLPAATRERIALAVAELNRCPCRKSNPGVLVVQAAENRLRLDASY